MGHCRCPSRMIKSIEQTLPTFDEKKPLPSASGQIRRPIQSALVERYCLQHEGSAGVKNRTGFSAGKVEAEANTHRCCAPSCFAGQPASLPLVSDESRAIAVCKRDRSRN